MSYPDQERNRATDARTNAAVALLDRAISAPSELAELRRTWTDMPSTPRVLANRRQGEDNSWPGFDVRTLLRGEHSNGRFSAHSLILAPGAELAPHYHEVGDVYYVVVEGEVELTIGSKTGPASAQAFGFAPPRTTQAIRNRSAAPAEVFMIFSPAGADRAFVALHKLWRDKPAATPDDYREVLARYGFVFTGGKAQSNDARVNQPPPRIDAVIETFDDYQALRRRWGELAPTPKFLAKPSQGRAVPVAREFNQVVLEPEESRGASSCFISGDDHLSYQAPSHHQPSEEEFFIVLDGPLRLKVGDTLVEEAPTGAFGFAPRFGTHAFSNMREDHFVLVFTMNAPGGHDRGFELAQRAAGSPRFPELITAHGYQFHPPA